MTQEELKKISCIQLEMMDEVHRFCEENNITYYMIGGTLLGAVRHKGFIPWDLDIDIAMPRDDYERFKNIYTKTKQLNGRYEYLDYESFQNYMRPHALISHRGTRIKTKYDNVNPCLMELGVYIDIFPLDNAPDDTKEQERHAKQLLSVRKLKGRRLMYSYSYKRWRRWVHYIMAAGLSWISVRKINEYQQALMQKYAKGNTSYICSMASQYAYEKQCMPREIYGEPILLEFEGRYFYAPREYEEYLRRLYGDYMKLPPIEKRQANLEFYTSFEYI